MSLLSSLTFVAVVVIYACPCHIVNSCIFVLLNEIQLRRTYISRKTHVSVRASVKLDYCLPSRELSQRMPRAPRRNQIFSDCRLLLSVLPFIHSFIHSFLLSFLRFSVAARHRPTFVHWLQVISYTPAGSAGMMNYQVWWCTGMMNDWVDGDRDNWRLYSLELLIKSPC